LRNNFCGAFEQARVQVKNAARNAAARAV
jgi:hypothetical protein